MMLICILSLPLLLLLRVNTPTLRESLAPEPAAADD
jgi:hypothetical protein